MFPNDEHATLNADRTMTTTACGIIQGERQRRDEVTTQDRYSDAHGWQTSLTLQLPGPFGTPYALPVRLNAATAGRELLRGQDVAPGAALHVAGRLVWERVADARFATDWTDAGRRTLDAVLYAEAIRPATADDAPGCDVQMQGEIVSRPRFDVHSQSGQRIYVLTMQTTVTETRPHSRARISSTVRVPLVLPRNHRDANTLLRRGNTVLVEGILERVAVMLPQTDRAVQRKLTAEEQTWQAHQADLEARGATRQLRDERRRWEQQQRRLLTATSCRVVVGYAELVRGRPLSREERGALDRRRDSGRAAAGTASRVVQPPQTEEETTIAPDTSNANNGSVEEDAPAKTDEPT